MPMSTWYITLNMFIIISNTQNYSYRNKNVGFWRFICKHIFITHLNKITNSVTTVLTGCDINCQNNKGYTPLHRAASRGDTKIIKCLLRNGKFTIFSPLPHSVMHNAWYLLISQHKIYWWTIKMDMMEIITISLPIIVYIHNIVSHSLKMIRQYLYASPSSQFQISQLSIMLLKVIYITVWCLF